MIIENLIDRIDRNIRMDGNLANSITNCINAKNPKNNHCYLGSLKAWLQCLITEVCLLYRVTIHNGHG